MAANKVATKDRRKTTAAGKGFSAEERAAMKAMLQERRASKDRATGEAGLQKAIAALPEPDRGLAKKIHAIVTDTAPDLWGKTWYGMPAYAKDGKVVCFFKPASKFKQRYGTFGFEEAANLDDGTMWVTSFAVTKLTPADEAKIKALVKKAIR